MFSLSNSKLSNAIPSVCPCLPCFAGVLGLGLGLSLSASQGIFFHRGGFFRRISFRGIKNPRGKRPGVISGPPSPAWPLPPSPPTPPKHPNFPCFPMLPPSPIPRRDETLPRRGLEILKTHTFAQLLQKESPPYLFFSKSYSTFKTKLSQKTPSESSLFVHNFFSARPIGLKFWHNLDQSFPCPEQFSSSSYLFEKALKSPFSPP